MKFFGERLGRSPQPFAENLRQKLSDLDGNANLEAMLPSDSLWELEAVSALLGDDRESHDVYAGSVALLLMHTKAVNDSFGEYPRRLTSLDGNRRRIKILRVSDDAAEREKLYDPRASSYSGEADSMPAAFALSVLAERFGPQWQELAAEHSDAAQAVYPVRREYSQLSHKPVTPDEFRHIEAALEFFRTNQLNAAGLSAMAAAIHEGTTPQLLRLFSASFRQGVLERLQGVPVANDMPIRLSDSLEFWRYFAGGLRHGKQDELALPAARCRSRLHEQIVCAQAQLVLMEALARKLGYGPEAEAPAPEPAAAADLAQVSIAATVSPSPAEMRAAQKAEQDARIRDITERARALQEEACSYTEDPLRAALIITDEDRATSRYNALLNSLATGIPDTMAGDEPVVFNGVDQANAEDYADSLTGLIKLWHSAARSQEVTAMAAGEAALGTLTALATEAARLREIVNKAAALRVDMREAHVPQHIIGPLPVVPSPNIAVHLDELYEHIAAITLLVRSSMRRRPDDEAYRNLATAQAVSWLIGEFHSRVIVGGPR